jgi:hypothetical protein
MFFLKHPLDVTYTTEDEAGPVGKQWRTHFRSFFIRSKRDDHAESCK